MVQAGLAVAVLAFKAQRARVKVEAGLHIPTMLSAFGLLYTEVLAVQSHWRHSPPW